MMPVRHVWRTVKKHPVKGCLVGAIAVSFLSILVASLSLGSPTMPSFGFLGGRRPVLSVRDEDTLWGRESSDFYSYMTDFRSVREAAEAELAALGYAKVPQFLERFSLTRTYRLRPSPSGETITVRIRGTQRLVVLPLSNHSQSSSYDRYEYKHEDGWTSVEIREQRRLPWLQEFVVLPVRGLLWKMGLYGRK